MKGNEYLITVNATVESLLYEADQYMNRQKCGASFV